jgi:O-antigen/teichoic acid export membrane protein
MAVILGAGAVLAVSALYPLLTSSVFDNVRFDWLLIALLLVPTTIHGVYWNAMMIGLNRLVLMNKVNLVLSIWNTVFMILAVGVFQWGIPGFLGAWSASAVGGMIWRVLLANRIEPMVFSRQSSALRTMLSFGLRGHGANIAHNVFLRFDVYAVNALVGTLGVGFYSLSTSLAEKLWLPINALHAGSLGKIAQLPRDEAALLTAKVARAALLITLSVAVPLAVVSPWLVPLLYGNDFVPSVLPLVILLAGTVGFAIMFVLNSYILGQMERPGLLSIISWLQLGISVPLYLALITWLGIVGAAIASSITYLFAMLASLIVFARDSGLSPLMVLVPRPSDFGDYARVLQRAWRRLPLVNRQART